MPTLKSEDHVWPFEKFGKNIAVVSELGEIFTYEALGHECKLLSQGLETRALAFCLCKNSLGSLLGYMTFLDSQVVPLMLDASIDSRLLQELMKTYQPSYIWAPHDIVIEGVELTEVTNWHDYSLFKLKSSSAYNLFDELSLLMTTSGSTGSRKLVRLSLQNLISNARSIIEYLELTEAERAITTLPMNYSYGLSVINSHLLSGASILVTDKSVMTKDFWTQMSQFSITSIAGVPYTYELLDRLRFYKMDLPSLRKVTQAGGKLSVTMHQKLAAYAEASDRKFYAMYGQTEATARMAYLPPEFAKDKAGSIGIAIPGSELILVDVDGSQIVNPNQPGELLFRGPNVALGYAESGLDLALGDQFQGEILTGDMGKRDDEGFFYIVGRKSRFLKVFGNRVNLDELESLIKAELDLVDIACAGVDDKIAIYTTDESLSKEILTLATRLTGLNHFAFAVKHISFIPKNEAGKVMHSSLGD